MTRRPSPRAILQRSRLLSLLCLLSIISAGPSLASSALAADLSLPGPGGAVEATVTTDEAGRLRYRVQRDGRTVIEPSRLGIRVDGVDLGDGVEVRELARTESKTWYPWHGVRSEAIDHHVAYRLGVTHRASGREWCLEVRVFDDGVGIRYRVPGTGRRRVDGEATSWTLPAEAAVWHQTNTSNYEGAYSRARPEAIPLRTGAGQRERATFLGPPVTAELPGGGYALISEASLYRYSGMTLRPTGTRELRAAFQDDPKGFVVEGPIVSPWRVTILAGDLQGLVSSTLIPSLGEPPDPELFPDGVRTEWIRPGKGLITWCVFGNNGAAWPRQKWFVDHCAALGCEYLLVDGGWRSERWGWLKDGGDLWARLDELCRYAETKGVGIFVWHAYPEGREDSPGLTDREKRRAFLRRVRDAGVRGVKIDFFDSERKEIVDVYEDILRTTAELGLMVNFHGANKPTGEVRTWPHEITREGIREQEYLLWGDLPLEHYGALPFTRMVAGFGDFLPTYVRPKYLKNTTAVFQLATAIIFTSPFICWPDHPEPYLESPFLPLIRTMPPVWDETRVLPGSKIGELVAFARRSGGDWHVAVLNTTGEGRDHSVRLDFLDPGEYRATICRDGAGARTAVRMETGILLGKDQSVPTRLAAGGGLVIHLAKPGEYTK